jgi:hypothetical protein
LQLLSVALPGVDVRLEAVAIVACLGYGRLDCGPLGDDCLSVIANTGVSAL